MNIKLLICPSIIVVALVIALGHEPSGIAVANDVTLGSHNVSTFISHNTIVCSGNVSFTYNFTYAEECSDYSDSTDTVIVAITRDIREWTIAGAVLLLLLLTGILVTVLVIGRAKSRRINTKLQLDSTDPFRLLTSKGLYLLTVTRGRVGGTVRELETKINVRTTTTVSSPGSTSRGYTPPSSASTSTSTTSTTITHDRFFIVDASGREVPIHLVDWNVSMRDGQLVSMVRATREGDDSRRGALLHNHSTNSWNWGSFFSDAVVPNKSTASEVFGCLLLLAGFLFIFPMLTMLIAGMMQGKHERRVLSEFLATGLAPLTRALDASAPTNAANT